VSALRETSRPRPALRESSPERMPEAYGERPGSRHSNVSGKSGRLGRPTTLSRKELAAKELEERRLSLARRPSAPIIPHPGELALRPVTERSHTDSDFLQTMSAHGGGIQRSQTADPEISKKYSPTNKLPLMGTSTPSMPIGLPATPRAMRHPRYMSTDPNERERIPAVPTIPDELAGQMGQADGLGPLLPSSTFGQISGPTRAASAPPEDVSPTGGSQRQSPITAQPPLPRRGSLSRGHARMNTSPDLGQGNFKRASPPPITASIDETIHENQVVILESDPNAPMILPELQHLSAPPPPPPPPLFSHSPKGSLGVINIAIDENPTAAQSRSPLNETISPVAGSPLHRRGRGSVSENLGMTFRKVTDRMRSTSRSRNKSPPMPAHEPAPYESLPPFSFPRSASARSPVEGNNNQFGNMAPPSVAQRMDPVSPQDGSNNAPFYRHPKEIRANMPPAQLQQGAYQPTETPPMV
jgi:hypothetical protein